MSKIFVCSMTALVTLLAVGCGGFPKPEARLASSEGAIRGAEEAGAQKVPQATLHLKLAQEERAQALKLIENGDNERAEFTLARSEADAELAVALARESTAEAEAKKTLEEVQELKKKAAQ